MDQGGLGNQGWGTMGLEKIVGNNKERIVGLEDIRRIPSPQNMGNITPSRLCLVVNLFILDSFLGAFDLQRWDTQNMKNLSLTMSCQCSHRLRASV